MNIEQGSVVLVFHPRKCMCSAGLLSVYLKARADLQQSPKWIKEIDYSLGPLASGGVQKALVRLQLRKTVRLSGPLPLTPADS